MTLPPLLLIHGSGHGAWCWRDVLPELAARGVTARAIDLPGAGDDTTPLDQVSLDASAAAILAAIDEPAVVVGHSLGGMAITQAAETAPEKIARLVYLTAWAPRDGDSAARLRAAAGTEALLAAIASDDDGMTTHFRDEMLRDVFYHDCPDEALAFARARLRPQPAIIGRTPARLTGRGDAVPKTYILCEEDRAIPPHAQRLQCDGWEDVRSLPSSHSPFFACPGALAEMLAQIARG